VSDARDRACMARALELARHGLYTTDPNPRVGCVLARDGEVVGEGWHEYAGGPHAEVQALRDAGGRAAGATAYVTLEPCRHHGRTPPCTDALIEAGIRRIIAAMPDPDPRTAGEGLAQLRAAGIAVESGLFAAEAEALNPGFVSRHRRGRPFVRCKLGMTLDGRVAAASGESRWITAAAARRDVQRLRARSSAIMTGIGTVLADDPALTVRAEELFAVDGNAGIDRSRLRRPLRVIVDSRLRLPASARMLAQPGPVVIATAAECERAGLPGREGVEIRCFAANGDGRVDLAALLAFLAGRHVNELLLEAGPTLSGAMVAAGLVDELVIYLAPKMLGDSARGLFTLPGLERLDQAIGVTVADVRAVGENWRITARLSKPG
jgi:diaminohydroxyphosphoribosylaminopyrimidine deaminase / 5-amino-6-(5-phosphoribosylamino)uracil reductase